MDIGTLRYHQLTKKIRINSAIEETLHYKSDIAESSIRQSAATKTKVYPNDPNAIIIGREYKEQHRLRINI
jgi:hypothetical protein